MTLILDQIRKSKKVALFTHVNPDADGLGCMCALFLSLKKLGISAKMFCDGTVPPKYSHLSCGKQITSEDISEKYDLFISVDASSLERIGKFGEAFKNAKESIVFDHHPTNTLFGKTNSVEATSASCCEMIYVIILGLGVELDKEIASALFGGIFSDTGGFCNGNSTSRCLKIAAELSSYCPNYQEITFNLFKKRSQKEFLLWKKAMAENEFVLKNKVSISTIRYGTLQDLGASEQDTSFIINVSGMVEGILINVFICESDCNLFKVSFRSQNNIDVGLVAKNLGGGGHKNASGCSLVGSYKNILAKIIEECEKEITRWKKAE